MNEKKLQNGITELEDDYGVELSATFREALIEKMQDIYNEGLEDGAAITALYNKDREILI